MREAERKTTFWQSPDSDTFPAQKELTFGIIPGPVVTAGMGKTKGFEVRKFHLPFQGILPRRPPPNIYDVRKPLHQGKLGHIKGSFDLGVVETILNHSKNIKVTGSVAPRP